MTARFRCPECKQALCNPNGDDPARGFVLKCPDCGARLVVPPALASLPSPQIEAPASGVADDDPHYNQRRTVVLPAMARSMPWLMSMFMHLGLALIFMFVVMIATPDAPDLAAFPTTFNTGPIDLTPVVDNTPDNTQTPRLRNPGSSGGGSRLPDASPREPLEAAETNVVGPAGIITGLNSNSDPAKLAEVSADSSIFGDTGRGRRGRGDGDGGDGGGPTPGGLPDVVYLIDRSGSMIDTFDRVRHEMLLSVGKIEPDRRFHVVLFSDGRPLEKSPRRMTPASKRAKVDLVEFLKPVRAYGKTDPIPAINRAFDAITRGGSKRATIIYLLTDGVFPDNHAVMATIRRRSLGQRIRINTILYGNRPPIAEKVMMRIAADTGGAYQFISSDE